MTYLWMRGITKRFPGVIANDNVDFAVEAGEIHALVGENGAGKSTLMNILYGLLQPDAGQIFLEGKRIQLPSPHAAIRLGIGMVHQNFQLVPSLTAAENVVLGYEPRQGIFVDRAEMMARVEQLAEAFGLKIDPTKRVADLSVGIRQRVEILKLLYRDAKLLILDEPTAVLTPQEVETLFEVIRRLVSEGRTAIFITHKLREVMAICDRATVMRRGKVVGTVQVADTSPAAIAHMMVGREIEIAKRSTQSHPQAPILVVKDLCADDERGLPTLQNISFTLHGGEIVGLAGVEGNGQHELLEVLTGLRSARSGEIFIGGTRCTHLNGRRRRELGLALIPEDRHHEGLSAKLSIWENIAATRYYQRPQSRWGVMNISLIQKTTKALMGEFDIRAGSQTNPIQTLSGGNAQKVVIARELAHAPKVLIAAQPTRGLDVGAAEFVHEQLLDIRNKGIGILLLSADLDELLAICDRFLVIFEGRIIGNLEADAASREQLGMLMAGRVPTEEAQ